MYIRLVVSREIQRLARSSNVASIFSSALVGLRAFPLSGQDLVRCFD